MAAAEASASDAPRPWDSHPAYARYWRHYRQAAAWVRSHRRAYGKALQARLGPPGYCAAGLQPRGAYAEYPPRGAYAEYPPQGAYAEYPPQGAYAEYPPRGAYAEYPPQGAYAEYPPQGAYAEYPQLPDHRMASRDSRCSGARCCTRGGQLPCSSTRPQWEEQQEEEEEEEEEQEEEEEEEEEVECDLSNMEITEELRQFFATTEKHRAERRRQQQLDAARLDDYVDAGHDLYYSRRSAEAPAQRPGERRRAEMALLYGEAAARIQAMEAAVQLGFDKHCDRRRPKYWPVIPLRF
ncbi:gem-associated protein 8-like [Ochotona curzoniae]|uniref:gem-associated protein 8-like n=1 Tax=Ochotona curzoniae TaxID=130825 RepID=UPI001B353B3D|nr:gem-associated protein 8-like [Ochotona curzoniae]